MLPEWPDDASMPYVFSGPGIKRFLPLVMMDLGWKSRNFLVGTVLPIGGYFVVLNSSQGNPDDGV